MLRPRMLAALAVLAAAAAPVAEAATSSNAKLWQNKSHSVVCGLETHVTKQATEVLCSAVGIPRARQQDVGDPFVQIAAKGRPQLVLISENSFVPTKIKTLARGTTWKSIGVTCKIASKTVTCSNGSAHGFTIGNHKYKAF